MLAGFSFPREGPEDIQKGFRNTKKRGVNHSFCDITSRFFYVHERIRTHDLPLRRQLPGSPSESIVDYLIQILYTRAFTLLIHLNIAEYLSGPSESISFS